MNRTILSAWITNELGFTKRKLEHIAFRRRHQKINIHDRNSPNISDFPYFENCQCSKKEVRWWLCAILYSNSTNYYWIINSLFNSATWTCIVTSCSIYLWIISLWQNFIMFYWYPLLRTRIVIRNQFLGILIEGYILYYPFSRAFLTPRSRIRDG
jgi:hypothetical protein